jgi:hypothetical protein
MKKSILIFCWVIVVSGVSIAGQLYSEGRVVNTDSTGSAVSLGSFSSGKPRELRENEYPMDYAFPTNAMMYWKKVGNDWVGMTEPEQATVNSNIQQTALETATDDEISDAMLGCIAEAIKQNAKTKAEVKAIFKDQVDPKKKKKDKSK